MSTPTLTKTPIANPENRYKLLVEHAISSICEIDHNGKISSINEIGTQIFLGDENLQNAIGKDFLDFVSERDKHRIEKLLQKAFEGQRSRFEFKIANREDDICLSSSFVPLFDQNKNVFRIMNMGYDISDHKKTENMLFNAQKKYRSVIDNIPDILCEISEDGTILFINKLVEGYSLDKVIGAAASGFLDSEFKPVFASALKNVAKTKQPQEYEARSTSPLGEKTWWNSRLVPLHQDGSNIRYLLINENITEKKKAQEEKRIIMEQLFQAQKLESLGKLAGGVAHEFNNLLAVILLHCTMLWDEIQGHQDSEDALNIIVKSAERAEELTQQLLGFARKGKYGSKAIDLNSIINEAANLLKTTLSNQTKTKLKVDLKKTLPMILGSESQVLQILMNLGLNAIDAMPLGGQIEISTFTQNLKDPFTNKKRLHSCIKILDTGEGISKENIKKIFDPFFTTKDIGKGTGLGLSMAYGIMENHDGKIEVESEIKKGTQFTLYFPALGCVDN